MVLYLGVWVAEIFIGTVGDRFNVVSIDETWCLFSPDRSTFQIHWREEWRYGSGYVKNKVYYYINILYL